MQVSSLPCDSEDHRRQWDLPMPGRTRKPSGVQLPRLSCMASREADPLAAIAWQIKRLGDHAASSRYRYVSLINLSAPAPGSVRENDLYFRVGKDFYLRARSSQEGKDIGLSFFLSYFLFFFFHFFCQFSFPVSFRFSFLRNPFGLGFSCLRLLFFPSLPILSHPYSFPIFPPFPRPLFLISSSFQLFSYNAFILYLSSSILIFPYKSPFHRSLFSCFHLHLF